MKPKILFFFSLLTVVSGCENDDDKIQTSINGTYSGIFERNENTSNVELIFNDGTFSGQSEIEKFPGICNGTYEISGNTIIFNNNCPWTAEFDWPLVLSDEWDFNFTNNILTMTNLNGDKYTLTQQ